MDNNNNNNNKILTIIIGYEDVYNAVTRATSLLGDRLTSQDGVSLFERIVFDKEYEEYFKEMFLDASAKVEESVIAFTRDKPIDEYIKDERYVNVDNDFTLTLFFDKNFKMIMFNSIERNIRSFFINYIIFEWLKDKQPKESEVYYLKFNEYLDTIGINIQRGNLTRRLKYRYF